MTTIKDRCFSNSFELLIADIPFGEKGLPWKFKKEIEKILSGLPLKDEGMS